MNSADIFLTKNSDKLDVGYLCGTQQARLEYVSQTINQETINKQYIIQYIITAEVVYPYYSAK
jgi:hypothetical protein